MKIVGLSGGIGSGKSTIAKMFNILNIPVYNSDERAKYLMKSNNFIIESLKKEFGENVYLKNGEINKPFLSKMVFNNIKTREIINTIVHPIVKTDFDSWTKFQDKADYLIQESALLFEKDLYKRYDYTITVSCPSEIRAHRICNRDNCTFVEAEKKINAQVSDEKRIFLADFEIVNDNNKLIIPQVIDIHNKILSTNGKIQ